MAREEETCKLKPRRDAELREKGWTYRFATSGARLREAEDLYRSLGFEVHLEPINPEDVDETCRACLKAEPETLYALYTRPKGDAKLDELYE